MAVRKIVQIDESLCDGCGLCIPNCAEGALQIVDGKAKLISDVYCDGLGSCLGHCPQGAIRIVEREADEFDEAAIEERLKEETTAEQPQAPKNGHQCPGTMVRSFMDEDFSRSPTPQIELRSELRTWPVQLHLLNPMASYLKGADFLLSADCVAFAHGDFHRKFIRGRVAAIACPKLDKTEPYIPKLEQIFRTADLKSLTILHMEVPCCGGLIGLVQEALRRAGGNSFSIHLIQIGIKGDVLNEQTFSAVTEKNV